VRSKIQLKFLKFLLFSSKLLADLDKAKLLQIATCIFNNFGSNEDHNKLILNNTENNENGLLVVISTIFPQYKMPLNLQQNILAMSEMASNSDSSIYRVLVKNLISDRSVWEKSNAEIILKDHQIIQAAFQFINSLRKTFSFKHIRYILGKICNEARADRKKRKTEQVDSPVDMDSVDSVDSDN
jgi:hypothetical protein